MDRCWGAKVQIGLNSAWLMRSDLVESHSLVVVEGLSNKMSHFMRSLLWVFNNLLVWIGRIVDNHSHMMVRLLMRQDLILAHQVLHETHYIWIAQQISFAHFFTVKLVRKVILFYFTLAEIWWSCWYSYILSQITCQLIVSVLWSFNLSRPLKILVNLIELLHTQIIQLILKRLHFGQFLFVCIEMFSVER